MSYKEQLFMGKEENALMQIFFVIHYNKKAIKVKRINHS